MRTPKFWLLLIATSAMLGAEPGAAAVLDTYISADGSDANTCERASPCRSLSKGITETLSGGRLVVLGPDAFGGSPVTLSKSITIEGETTATVHSNQIFKITDNVTVILRKLRFSSSFVAGLQGAIGISMEGSGSLLIEDVYINNKIFQANAACLKILASGEARIDIKNLTAFNCGNGATGGAVVIDGAATTRVSLTDGIIGSSTRGVVLQGAGNVQLSLERTTISNSAGNGIEISKNAGTTKLIIKDSTIANNTGNGLMIAPTGAAKVNTTIIGSAFDSNVIGIRSFPAGSAVSNLSISDTSASNNAGGIHASGKSVVGIIRGNVSGNSSYGIGAASPAAVRVGSSIVNGNILGMSGPVSSYGNNQLLGNTTQGSSTPVAPGSVP